MSEKKKRNSKHFHIHPSVTFYMCHAKFCNLRISVPIPGADARFLTGEGGGGEGRGPNLLFKPVFSENCMKMNKIWSGRGEVRGTNKILLCRSATGYQIHHSIIMS